MQSEGEGEKRSLAFRLNSDDLVIAGPDHIIELRNDLPYLHVRGGLWAKLSRAAYYDLVDIALDESPEAPRVWSNGMMFAVGAPV